MTADDHLPNSARVRGQPSNFSAQDCHTCALLSDIAYEDKDPEVELARLRAETKCSEFLWFFKENDQAEADESRRFKIGGFVTKDPSNIYIVFRGTWSQADAITDLRIAMVPTINRKLPFLKDYMGSRSDEEIEAWNADSSKDDEKLDTTDRTINCLSNCSCSKPKEAWEHKGFAISLSSVWWDMEKRIKEILKDSPLPIIVTGHSLGGASAMLMTFHATFPIKAVYTFGQPRVGGSSFANLYSRKRLDEKTFRVIKDQDLVPRAPPVTSGYRHVGRSLYIPTSSDGSKVTPIWDLSTLSLWRLGLFSCCFNKGPRGVRDHGTRGYVEETKRLLPDGSL